MPSLTVIGNPFGSTIGASEVDADLATQAELDAVGRDRKQAGQYAPDCPGWSVSTLTLTANALFGGRFVASRSRTVASISYVVSTFATADDPVEVAICDSTGAKIVASGAVSGKLNASNGVKNVTFAATPLTAGTVYYATISMGALGGTAATLRAATLASGTVATIFGSSLGTLEFVTGAANHPLGSSIASPNAAATVPILAVLDQ